MGHGQIGYILLNLEMAGLHHIVGCCDITHCLTLWFELNNQLSVFVQPGINLLLLMQLLQELIKESVLETDDILLFTHDEHQVKTTFIHEVYGMLLSFGVLYSQSIDVG